MLSAVFLIVYDMQIAAARRSRIMITMSVVDKKNSLNNGKTYSRWILKKHFLMERKTVEYIV